MAKFIYLLMIVLVPIIGPAKADPSAETVVKIIPLSSPLDVPNAQLSGLTWCGNELLLLPQRPRFGTAARPSLYTLEKNQVLNAIKSEISQPLNAKAIQFNDNALRAGLSGFDGYEAIVCRDDDLWLAIETKIDENRIGEKAFTTNVVKAARLSPDKIEANHEVHSTIKSGSGIWNLSDETLVLAPDALIAIHEANAVSAKPQATVISLISGKQIQIPIPPLPYRITDATALDAANRFWVINYQWQDDEFLANDDDWIANKFPLGATHRSEKNVERLIELELTETGILRTETPPIYLQLSGEKGRNWEGIVRLDDLGFLLVSDEYPTSYFGFVPFDF